MSKIKDIFKNVKIKETNSFSIPNNSPSYYSYTDYYKARKNLSSNEMVYESDIDLYKYNPPAKENKEKENMIVTRFCPSNTGWLHLGSARTALYAYAFAKASGGKCILRIEDTDQKRSTYESLVDIVEGLEWLGLNFDDGPSIEDIRDKEFSSNYFQSKRQGIYDQYVEKLLKEDKAYKQDGVVLFRMPKENVVVNDLIVGTVTFPASEQKDFVIRREDGSCLFHIAVVVDDALSGVSHVIRANDHLTNTPKHIQLYKALGFKVPEYAHMPLILDDKGAKLSKRREDQLVLIKDFRANGYLPEAIINLLGTLGWSNQNGADHFGLDYICGSFKIKDCNKVNARYDAAKLKSINQSHIQELPVDYLTDRVIRYGRKYHPKITAILERRELIYPIAETEKTKIRTLKELFDRCSFIVTDTVEYSEAATKILTKDGSTEILSRMIDVIRAIPVWNKGYIDENIRLFIEDNKFTMNKVAQPIRAAITGTDVSPGIDATIYLLGREMSIIRMQEAVQKFGKQVVV
jgi:glutamyl-tRNA synthetase